MKIKKILTSTLLTLIFLSVSLNLKARHIVGGEASYKLISSDKKIGGRAVYEVKFVIYRDANSGGGDFDKKAFIGIFKEINGNWSFYKRVNIAIDRIATIKNVLNPCVVAPAQIRYEKGEYIFRISLPIINSSYKLTYQRCCRTDFIVNIKSPESTGATYFVNITPEAQLVGNSSPILKAFPPTVLCANSFFEFDHSAVDPDGDSLVFEFFNPLNGGGILGAADGTGNLKYTCKGVIPKPDNCPPPYPKVNFVQPYSFSTPILGDPNITIDKKTGILTGKPINFGQFVVGVRVKEYRQGVFIGEIQRDFQFQVTVCTPAVNALVGNSSQIDINKFDVISCGKDSVSFINHSYYKNKIKTTNWEFYINNDTIKSNDWNAKIGFPGEGEYDGKLYLNRYDKCRDTAHIKVHLYPAIHADFDYKHDSCSVDSILFSNKSFAESGKIDKTSWNFGNGTNSILKDPKLHYENAGKYHVSLIVEDKNKCKDTAETFINYYPVADHITVKPSRYLACTPAAIKFLNYSTPFEKSYEISWDFGDGKSDSSFEPIHVYNEAGTYTVNVHIKSPNGCELDGYYSNWIEVRESPLADFNFSPAEINIIKPEVSFINNSENGKAYQWDFNSGEKSFEFEPIYTFPDTGEYKVMLIAKAENHCTDTIIKNIYINSDVRIFYPNAFSPNGDGVNDDFVNEAIFPKYIRNFNLVIFDRWGGLVFKTNDPQLGWQGSKFNSGSILPQGVYVYKYNYTNPNGKVFNGKGFVTLIK